MFTKHHKSSIFSTLLLACKVLVNLSLHLKVSQIITVQEFWRIDDVHESQLHGHQDTSCSLSTTGSVTDQGPQLLL